jgi:acyl-CoA thioester hydrolase
VVGMTKAAAFGWTVRVYYEDTDHGGVVYYANYLKFMERARTEWLRSRGIQQDVVRQELGLIFAVRSIQVDYLKPARFNQLLDVSVDVQKAGKASIMVEQTVRLADPGSDFQQHAGGEGQATSVGQVLCSALVKIASLDAQTLKPRPLPDTLRKEIFGDS